MSHTAPENDRCKSSLYIYLTTKCIQHWAPFRLSIWAENRTRADLTSFCTSDSKRYEARTQRWHDTDLKARYWSLTLSGCWKWTKIQESAFSLTTAYTSIVGVSDMHMNRNRKSFTIVSGCRKVKPKNSSTHIKNINMIALKQTNKKTMSRNYTNQNVPYMIWHKSLLWTFVLNHDQSGIWLCNLCFWNPDPNDRVIFISVAIGCHVQ